MGAYSGFTPFYSRPIDGQWDAKIVQVNNDEQLDAVWKALCSPKPLPGANLGASKAEADVATEVAVAPTPVPDSGKCRGAWRTRSEEETSLLLTVTADEVIYEGSDEPIFVSKPSAEANGDILFNYSDPAYKLRLRCHVTGATLQSERGAEKGEVTKLVRA